MKTITLIETTEDLVQVFTPLGDMPMEASVCISLDRYTDLDKDEVRLDHAPGFELRGITVRGLLTQLAARQGIKLVVMEE